ncbi:hypothetical protein ACFWYW_19715 [Nonomuraea sp. NPDC059023]|uniref:hypothetical protein n=1 Tax=unclassified Nonomuraea TaxID=2593643 RepID=UPI0036AD1712
MTGRWLTVTEAAHRLGLTVAQVEKLLDSGVLAWRRHDGTHLSIAETSVTALLAEHAKGPFWSPWSSADHPEDRDDQADFDTGTPNDEGDEH